MKRLFALLLCLAMLVCVFASCSEATEEDPGAYISMYFADKIYNLDPAYAYGNESALKIASLLYENLFVLNEKGQPEKSLVKSYKIDEKKNTMRITLRNDVKWSDGTVLSASDVIYAWERVLDPQNSFAAAALLYDVKNAKAAKEGDVSSIDDVGVEALNTHELLIEFEAGVDYDRFISNLASYALAPVRADVIQRTVDPFDWAKSTTTIITSGPFRVRQAVYTPGEEMLVLERNGYYRKDYQKDPLDKAVKPFRLVIDYSFSEAEILTKYENGEIFFIGDIPLSIRGTKTKAEWEKLGQVASSLSTHSYMFNTNAVVRYYDEAEFAKLSGSGCVYDESLMDGTDGQKIFANKSVRLALSLALDREAIASSVVFAQAATGLVPDGVFETNSYKTTFRDKATNKLDTKANITKAKELLSQSKVDPAKFMFAVSVPAYDAVHVAIAEQAVAAWNSLGFHVALNKIENVANKDTSVGSEQIIQGIYDDIFTTSYIDGKFEVAAIDYTAYSTDAFASLAPFAKGYTGGISKRPHQDFTIPVHFSGYNNKDFDAKIEAAAHEKNAKTRASILHEAEAILMNDMPIIPVVFNESITMIGDGLSKVEITYSQTAIFTNAKLKDHLDNIPPSQTEVTEAPTEAPAE